MMDFVILARAALDMVRKDFCKREPKAHERPSHDSAQLSISSACEWTVWLVPETTCKHLGIKMTVAMCSFTATAIFLFLLVSYMAFTLSILLVLLFMKIFHYAVVGPVVCRNYITLVPLTVLELVYLSKVLLWFTKQYPIGKDDAEKPRQLHQDAWFQGPGDIETFNWSLAIFFSLWTAPFTAALDFHRQL